MKKLYYNEICSIYRSEKVKVKGSLVQKKVLVYENIKCALWSTSKSLNPTMSAIQTDSNQYELNLMPENNLIQIGDIVSINGNDYLITNFIEHKNFRGKLDNLQVFIRKTTNGTNI